MRGPYPCKISSKMALKNTSMNNQRNNLAKLGDTLSQHYVYFLQKHISNAHIYGFHQDSISLPIQIKSFECSSTHYFVIFTSNWGNPCTFFCTTFLWTRVVISISTPMSNRINYYLIKCSSCRFLKLDFWVVLLCSLEMWNGQSSPWLVWGFLYVLHPESVNSL